MGIFDKLFRKTEVNKCEICGEIIHSDFLTCSSCKKTSVTKPVLNNLVTILTLKNEKWKT